MITAMICLAPVLGACLIAGAGWEILSLTARSIIKLIKGDRK